MTEAGHPRVEHGTSKGGIFTSSVGVISYSLSTMYVRCQAELGGYVQMYSAMTNGHHQGATERKK